MDRFEDITIRWFYMMDYCKQHGLNPADRYAWEQASNAYDTKNSKKIEEKNESQRT